MNVMNIRYRCFACNSSSDHSIIFINDGIQDFQPEGYNTYEFGWQYFTAASKDMKEMYLAFILYENLKDKLGHRITSAVVDDMLGIRLGDVDGFGWNEVGGYIDHQSVLCIPNDYHHLVTTDLEFFEDLSDFILSENIAIIGGSDNEENEHPLINLPRAKIPIGLDNVDDYIAVCRKDLSGYWAVFNKKTGTKVRFSFGDDTDITKASFPELVDMKITSACNSGCPWCYQDSTQEGAFADKCAVDWAIYNLSEHKVFEIAFGGGEPALHPDFAEFVDSCCRHGIVPNFTTRNLDYVINNPDVVRRCGSFAYSVSCVDDVDKLPDIPNAVIQVINGLIDLEPVLVEAKMRRLPVNILGFKPIGRGTNYQPKYDEADWIEIVRRLRDNYKLYRVGIDVALAKQFEKEIEELGIPHTLYYTEEGAFSAYVDCVDGLVAPSSYCKEVVKCKPGRVVEALEEEFGKW